PDAARKSWLKGHLNPEGVLVIDAGAASALQGGASLLPIGVKGVNGQFERGAALTLETEDGTVIAKGITAYSAADIRAIAGQHTGNVAEILGLDRRPAIIHRNDIALVD
ncbi:MAG: PUA domain-containing protein, partial [Hyphomonadaceae bacterium]